MEREQRGRVLQLHLECGGTRLRRELVWIIVCFLRTQSFEPEYVPDRDIVPESAGRGDLTLVDQIVPPPLFLLPRLCLPRPRQSQVVRSGRELLHLEEDGGNDHDHVDVDDGDGDDGMSCSTLERKARARSSRSQLRPTLICRSILVTGPRKCQDSDQLGLANVRQTL